MDERCEIWRHLRAYFMIKKIKNDHNHAFTDIIAVVPFESLIRFD